MPDTLNIENMSKDDVLALLNQNGINIKELAATAKDIKVNGFENTEKVKFSNETTWTVALDDHNDFAIKKQTGKNTWKMLVVMTNQGTCFFKDNKGQITKVTKELLLPFFRGMKRLEIPNSWVGHLEHNNDETKGLFWILCQPDILEGYKYGCGPEFIRKDPNDDHQTLEVYKQWKNAWELCSKIMREYKDNRKALSLVIGSPNFINEIEKRWGIDNVRDFLDSYTLSLIKEMPMERCWRNAGYVSLDSNENVWNPATGNYQKKMQCSIPDMTMEYGAFKDYVLYNSYRCGYSRNFKDFFKTWLDTLDMQKKIYGKVREKYPEHLLETHSLLSFQNEEMREKIDERNFAIQAEVAKGYEAKVGDYVFIAPKVKQDFLDEARMQMNCLASYVSKFANGDDIIMFMRKKDSPDTSLVTIELVKGRVVQKYQARNAQTTFEQNEVIDEWLKKIWKKQENTKEDE